MALPLESLVDDARTDLAARLGLALGAVHHVVIEQRTFRSSCLDASEEGELCLTVMVPGYVFVFTVIDPTTGQSASYRYHAGADGGVRLVGAEAITEPEPKRPAAEVLTAVASVLGGLAALLALRQ